MCIPPIKIQSPFPPDRAGRFPLNFVTQLNETASGIHIKNELFAKSFHDLSKAGLIYVVKIQDLKIFPEFYMNWKTNDDIYIHCELHDLGKTSLNLQFDTYDKTNSILLCTNMRTIVICDVQTKPHPIPENMIKTLQHFAMSNERYFIPPAFKAKSESPCKVSRIVQPSDLDTYYHVNHSKYFEYILDAALTAARQGHYSCLKQDIAFATVDHVILDYARELCLDELVNIETWQDNEHPMKICFEISSNSKIAFQGSIILKEPLLNFSDDIKKRFPRAKEF